LVGAREQLLFVLFVTLVVSRGAVQWTLVMGIVSRHSAVSFGVRIVVSVKGYGMFEKEQGFGNAEVVVSVASF
jgi:hypothetical protein